MAGIYLHIPFCKQACHYCNFHFSTSLQYKEDLLQAMLMELDMQKDYLNGAPLESIYLGGGTPSLLEDTDLNRLFDQIFTFHSLADHAEITLEANPDDLTPAKLQVLADSPVNRLSIGIQSFHEADLRFMNRAHTAQEALDCVKAARDYGFEQLSIDLIYGTPGMSDKQWEDNIQTIADLNIPHLSAYCLTVEPRTALHHFVKSGKALPVDDEQAARQFDLLIQQTEAAGFEHYEISNFAKETNYAVHNTNYWRGIPYLGIGPSAHSFDGQYTRQWNVANNARYIKAVQAGQLPAETEALSKEERYNEYVMTSLRTMWGCDSNRLEVFGKVFRSYFEKEAATHLRAGHMVKTGTCYTLTSSGKLLADQIASALFYTDF